MALLKHGSADQIAPSWTLLGETAALEDILHCEALGTRGPSYDWTIPAHRHVALHQFFAITQGGGLAVVDGVALPFEAGMLVSIPNGMIHEMHLRPESTGFVLTVAVQELPEVMRMSVARPTRLAQPFVIVMSDRLAASFPQIMEELARDEIYRVAALRAQAMQLAIEATRIASRSTTRPEAEAHSRHLSRALPLIRDHLADRWGVARLAREAGISRVHLNRLCRQVMGCTAQELIENVRFQEACRMLTYSDRAVAEVGFALGFEDPSYFSRAFRRKLGESPSDYRHARRDSRRLAAGNAPSREARPEQSRTTPPKGGDPEAGTGF